MFSLDYCSNPLSVNIRQINVFIRLKQTFIATFKKSDISEIETAEVHQARVNGYS